jgi:hypothetical protein
MHRYGKTHDWAAQFLEAVDRSVGSHTVHRAQMEMDVEEFKHRVVRRVVDLRSLGYLETVVADGESVTATGITQAGVEYMRSHGITPVHQQNEGVPENA